jgi:uncharacterized protein
VIWLYALLPVVLGGGLAAWAGRPGPWVGPLRTGALASAVVVVLLALLPEAAHELGGWALVAFSVGLVGPMVLQRLKGPSSLELAFWGLVLHQVLDGVQISAAEVLSEGGLVVALALAAHTTPLVASVAFSDRKRVGARRALVRTGMLLLATGVGVALGMQTATEAFSPFTPWVQAGLAGLLLHVLTHDLSADRPVGAFRLVELLAAAAGLVLPAALLMDHGHSELLGPLWEVTARSAPSLMLGLFAAAALQATQLSLPASWFSGQGQLNQALRGALAGGPLPICACGVLPLARALQSRGGRAALVAAFVMATPAVGLDGLLISGDLLGLPFAVARILIAVFVAGAGGLVLGLVVGDTPRERALVAAPPVHGGWGARWLSSFDQLLFHVGPWMLAGVVAATAFTLWLPAPAPGPWQLPALTAVSLPAPVCAAAAMPMGQALSQAGFSSGAVLTALVLGPALSVGTLGFLLRLYGARAVAAGTATVVALTWGLSLVVEGAGLELSAPGPLTAVHLVGAGVLGLAVLRGLWQTGPRAWFIALVEPAEAEDDDAHGHHHHH